MSRSGLTAKVLPPEPAGLVRERLLKAAATRLVVVVAPAGHGKTTLLGQIAASFDGPVAWYRLDSWDRGADAFATRIAPSVLAALVGADTGPVPPEHLSVEQLAPRLGQVLGPARGLLVLDDVHEVTGTETEDALVRLAGIAPGQLGIVLAGRRAPGLDLLSLRLSPEITVVDADDLRFRSWEVERLFRDVYAAPLHPEDAATLTVRTDGWAAGLAMFHLITASDSPGERRARLSALSKGGSRLVRSYLVREVLEELPGEQREFLRRTSVLGVLTGQLCDDLLERTGSVAVLEELEQRQIFTTAEDDGLRYRYHQVLQDHLELELREQLGAAASRAWYVRAAELLGEAGEVRAAFRALAVAGDWVRVEELLREHGETVVASPLGQLADLLPEDLTEHDPWLLVASARRLVARGALARAEAAYRRAETLAVDPEVAVLCREERRRIAVWGPDADVAQRDWRSVVRSATMTSPTRAREFARSLPGVDGRMALGLVALVAGDPATAAATLGEAVRHPAAGPDVVQLAGLGRAMAAFLDPTAVREQRAPITALEAVVLQAERSGQVAWARLARALSAVDQEDAALALELLTEEAVRDDDQWGAALIRFLDGAARGNQDLLDAAADGFAALQAPVLAHWARCLAAVRAAGESPALEAQSRALGVRGASATVLVWTQHLVARRPLLPGGNGGFAERLEHPDHQGRSDVRGRPEPRDGRGPGQPNARVEGAPAGGGDLSGIPVQGSPDPGPAADTRSAPMGDPDSTGPLDSSSAAAPAGALVAVPAGAALAIAAGAPAALGMPVAAGAPALRLRLLGHFDLEVAGVQVDLSGIRPRVRSALRLLALHAGTPVHRDILVGALWPDVATEAAYRSVQVAVSSLRHLLEPDAARGQTTLLRRMDETYTLVMPAGSVSDLVGFESSLRRAAAARQAGDRAAELAALEQALTGYRGDLLVEEGAAEWVLGDRDRLRLLAADSAERLARVCLAGWSRQVGDLTAYDSVALDGALAACRRSLALDPYRDSAWQLLVEMHELAGDAAAAENVRRRRRRVLSELGLEA